MRRYERQTPCGSAREARWVQEAVWVLKERWEGSGLLAAGGPGRDAPRRAGGRDEWLRERRVSVGVLEGVAGAGGGIKVQEVWVTRGGVGVSDGRGGGLGWVVGRRGEVFA